MEVAPRRRAVRLERHCLGGWVVLRVMAGQCEEVGW